MAGMFYQPFAGRNKWDIHIIDPAFACRRHNQLAWQL